MAPNKVIIFEDLCESGYDTIRHRLLTEEDIKSVLVKLAKFHAASFVLANSEESQQVTKYQDHAFNISVDFVKDLFRNGIKHLLELLKSKAEFSLYYEKVKKIEPVLQQKCKELYDAYQLRAKNADKGFNATDIFVLNHADFHMKNLMFKFNQSNQIEDVLMVDYQGCVFAPVAIDLFYCQYMILPPDLKPRRQEFMNFYFTQFLTMLEKLNYAGSYPNYSDLQILFLKYRHFGKVFKRINKNLQLI